MAEDPTTTTAEAYKPSNLPTAMKYPDGTELRG